MVLRRRDSSSSYTKGLPFEALFDARNALFGPILVAPSRLTNSPDDVETLSITGSAYATLDGLPASVT
jgi:hypothetical protein